MTDDELKSLVEKVFGGPSGYRSFDIEEALKVHPHLMKDFEGIARAVPKLLVRIAELEAQLKRALDRVDLAEDQNAKLKVEPEGSGLQMICHKLGCKRKATSAIHYVGGRSEFFCSQHSS